MKWNVISRLKMIFAVSTSRTADARTQSPDRIPIAERERELSARDYEIYYWCTSLAPWY